MNYGLMTMVQQGGWEFGRSYVYMFNNIYKLYTNHLFSFLLRLASSIAIRSAFSERISLDVLREKLTPSGRIHFPSSGWANCA